MQGGFSWLLGAQGALMIRFLTAVAAAVFLFSSAYAQEYKAGSLVIDHPWTRATPKGASVAGGYVRITNTGSAPDRLIGGSAEVARKFEVHEMSMDGGVMKMRELKDGLEIPAGATVELKPGSYHIMMINLAHPLAAGEKVKGSLTFEKVGKVDVEFAVQALGGNSTGMNMKDHMK
jgi:hypothetical protein